MKLTWLGHSCFLAETALGRAVFDPYAEGSVPGYGAVRVEAEAVFCSHDHRDHGAAQAVTLSGAPLTAQIEVINTYHDDRLGLLRGRNKIHILHAEGMRLAHLGDLGHMLSGSALKALRGVDVLLLPAGGHYTIDAKTAKKLADAVGARIVVPMHYRLGERGYPVLAELSDYTDRCDNVVYYPENTLEITGQTPAQTAVLTYIA